MDQGKRYRIWAAAIALGVAVFLLTACSAVLPELGAAPDTPFYTVRDSLGREVVLDRQPQRIVLLTASFVNMMHAVGGDFVAWANSPSDEGATYAQGKKTVGYTYQVDMEALLAEKPDLVIGLPGLHNRLQTTLEENRIPFLLLSLSRFADVKRAFGDLRPPEGGFHLPFSMEQLVERDPDILFLTTMVMPGKEQEAFKDNLMGHPSWRALKAVREGRVYFLPQKYFLTSPGVEYPKALQFMAQQLYPEQGLKGEG